jgi:hypothetical protein
LFLHFPILLTDDCSTEIRVKFIVVEGNFDNLCNFDTLRIKTFRKQKIKEFRGLTEK